MIPTWLHLLSIASLALAGLCALAIAVDVARHPQHMAIMNVVWPVTALFGSVVWLWLYFRYGRLATRAKAEAAMGRDEEMPSKRLTPFWAKVAKGASHCGSGCTLGDICAEWLAFAAPVVATWFGWRWLFGEKMFAVWVLDYVFAFAIGIAFQYFTIQPMRHLSVGEGLWQAVKADTLSLTAWQVGMYGFMAIAAFGIFRGRLGARLETDLARVLVRDAARDAVRLRHRLSGQLVADQERHQGGDVGDGRRSRPRRGGPSAPAGMPSEPLRPSTALGHRRVPFQAERPDRVLLDHQDLKFREWRGRPSRSSWNALDTGTRRPRALLTSV